MQQITMQSPAAWERGVSALAFLLTLTLYITLLPIATMVGFILYGSLRVRRPFVAYHGLHAAGWTVFIVFLQVALIILYLVAKILCIAAFPVFGLSAHDFSYPETDGGVFIAKLVTQFPVMWAVMGVPLRILVVLVLASVALTFTIALCGFVTTLRGKVFRVPIVGHMLDRMFKTTPISVTS